MHNAGTPSIGSLIKVKAAAPQIAAPQLGSIDLEIPHSVRLPAAITHQHAWFFDGAASTCPHLVSDGATVGAVEETLRPATSASQEVVYDVVDLRKPEYMLVLPEEHKQAGILIKHASLMPWHDIHSCNLQ